MNVLSRSQPQQAWRVHFRHKESVRRPPLSAAKKAWAKASAMSQSGCRRTPRATCRRTRSIRLDAAAVAQGTTRPRRARCPSRAQRSRALQLPNVRV
eukprot:2097929-Pleurochrysis_carterae.AAC.1